MREKIRQIYASFSEILAIEFSLVEQDERLSVDDFSRFRGFPRDNGHAESDDRVDYHSEKRVLGIFELRGKFRGNRTD